LDAAGIQLKPFKCPFAFTEVHYLGHVVSQVGDYDKVKAVFSYTVPRTIKE